MRASTWVLCALALGCGVSADLARARGYPCDPAAAKGCPDGERCGADARCHAIGVALDYVCATDDDCEAQWHCGLSGRCHPPTPDTYVCRADGDCEGWHCNLREQRCVDPSAAVASACDGDADCAAGWRCGLEQRCHARGVRAAYACASDTDCEGGDRCAFGGQCADVDAEGLLPGAAPSATPSRLSPRVPPDAVTFAGSFQSDVYFSFAADGGFTEVTLRYPGSGVDPPYAEVRRVEAEVPGLRALAVAPGLSHLGPLLTLGDLGLAAVDYDGGVRVLDAGIGAQNLGMEWSAYLHPNFAAATAFGGQKLWVVPEDESFPISELSIPASDGGLLEIRDVELLPDENLSNDFYDRTMLIAATDEGLFGLAFDRYFIYALAPGSFPPGRPDWTALVHTDFPNAQCPQAGEDGPGALRPTSIVSSGSYGTFRYSIEGVTAAGTHKVRSFDVLEFDLFSASQGYPSCRAVTSSALASLSESCALCAGPALGMSLSYDSMTAACSADCGVVTPRSQIIQDPLGRPLSACTLARPTTAAPVDQARVLEPSQNTLTVLSAHGLLGLQLDQQFTPLTLSGAHGALWQQQGVLHASTGAADGVITSFVDEPPLGLVQDTGPLRFQAVLNVDGDERLVVGHSGGPGAVLAIDTAQALGSLPFEAHVDNARQALRTPLRTGGEALLVAIDDKLWSADIPDAGTVSSFVTRLVPEAYVPVQSITAGIATDAGTSLDGYLVTSNSLHRFSRRLDGRWESERIDAPEKDWVEVWSENGRGRLGYADGEVRSLPHLVQLAPPFGTVVDYQVYCGATFALSPDGLYRLDVGQGPVGAWAQVALGSTISAPTKPALAGGKLHVLDGALYLVSGYGEVVRVFGAASCAQ